jgi:hypothetical protein
MVRARRYQQHCSEVLYLDRPLYSLCLMFFGRPAGNKAAGAFDYAKSIHGGLGFMESMAALFWRKFSNRFVGVLGGEGVEIISRLEPEISIYHIAHHY